MCKPANDNMIAVVGAGKLVSHLRRADCQNDRVEYRFSVLRFQPSGEATSQLRDSDLRDLVKLAQVIASAITDDGWLPEARQNELLDLNNRLDQVTQHWSGARNGKHVRA